MDFDKINIDAVSYNVKDTTARQQISDETKARKAADTALGQQINALKYQFIYTVAKNGADYTTIADAYNAMKGAVSSGNRGLILIMPGEYQETLVLLDTANIDFMAYVPESVTIASAAAYPDGPLRCSGEAVFYNITFRATSSNAYAFHYESQSSPVTSNLRFYNCRFHSLNSAGAGLGFGDNSSLWFINCEFITTNGGSSFYFHNHPYKSDNSYLYMALCKFVNNTGGIPVTADNAHELNNPDLEINSYLDVSISQCYARQNLMSFRKSASETLGFIPKYGQDEVRLLDSCFGNSIPGLNYYTSNYVQGGYFFVNPGGYFCIPIGPDGPDLMSATVYSANRNDGTDIKNTVTVENVTNSGYIFCKTTDSQAIADKIINCSVNISAKAP